MTNRNEYVKLIAAETGYTQKDVRAVLDTAQTIAYKIMAKKDEVKIFDGLTLTGVHKDATTARNPHTGAIIEVGEKIVPKAKFGAIAKRTVNGEE